MAHHGTRALQERERAGVVEWSRNQAVRHAQVRCAPPLSSPCPRLVPHLTCPPPLQEKARRYYQLRRRAAQAAHTAKVRDAVAAESRDAIEHFGAIASIYATEPPPASSSPRPPRVDPSLPLAARPDLHPDLGEAAAVVDRLRRRKVTVDEGKR